MNRLHKPSSLTLFSTIYFVVLIALLWLPFGFKSMLGNAEEWGYLVYFDQNDSFFFKIPWHLDRPLDRLFFWIPYIISPNSFIGFGIVLAGALFGKALVSYHIIRELLPELSFVALVSSVLFILYPLDRAIFLYRVINIHLAIFWTLLAIYCLIRYWKTQTFWWWIPIIVLQAIILLGYEGVLGWMVSAPLLLLAMERKITKRLLVTGIFWNIVPALITVRSFLRLGESQRFSTGIVPENSDESFIKMFSDSFQYMYRSHFQAWERVVADSSFQWDDPLLIISAISGLLFAGVAWQHFQQTNFENALSWKKLPLLIIGGLAVMFFGFVIFSMSNIHRFSNWRVFFMSSLGAGFLIAVVMFVLALLLKPIRLQIIAILLSSIFVGLATFFGLTQHQSREKDADNAQRLLSAIAESVPELDSSQQILLVDEAGISISPLTFWALPINKNPIFGRVLEYLYEEPNLKGYICYPEETVKRLDPLYQESVCQFLPNRVTYPNIIGANRSINLSYENLTIFMSHADGSVELLETIPLEYLADPIIQPTYNGKYVEILESDGYPDRALTLLKCFPIEDCLETMPPLKMDSVMVDFAQVVPGKNWLVSPIQDQYRWMTDTESTLLLELNAQDFTMRFKTMRSLKPEILESLAVFVADTEIALNRTAAEGEGFIYEGYIPAELISNNASPTVITFRVDSLASWSEIVEDGSEQPLGVLMDWFELQPISPVGN